MKGMILKPESIGAIKEGRKTQTRRVIKPQPPINYHSPIKITGTDAWGFQKPSCAHLPFLIKPRYQVGETVYIKEAWTVFHCIGRSVGIKYTDGFATWVNRPVSNPNPSVGYHSPMMMPKWAARYFITITDVRAERLREITEADALAEAPPDYDGWFETWKDCFRVLWHSINKDYPWESNPWVWVYTFRLKQ